MYLYFLLYTHILMTQTNLDLYLFYLLTITAGIHVNEKELKI